MVAGVENGGSHCRQTVTESPCPRGMSSGRAGRENQTEPVLHLMNPHSRQTYLLPVSRILCRPFTKTPFTRLASCDLLFLEPGLSWHQELCLRTIEPFLHPDSMPLFIFWAGIQNSDGHWSSLDQPLRILISWRFLGPKAYTLMDSS